MRLGGVDLATAEPASLRSAVALVFQEAFLFAATVRENLALGWDAGDEDLRWALDAPGPGASSIACPWVSTNRWASGASPCRAASASAWHWPGPCCAAPAC